MRKPVARSFLSGVKMLLACLLLYVAGAGLLFAEEPVSAGLDDPYHGVVQNHVHQEQAVSKPVAGGLKKVLTNKYPRRTDIPDSILVVMLALIGIIIIARRDVSVEVSDLQPRKD